MIFGKKRKALKEQKAREKEQKLREEAEKRRIAKEKEKKELIGLCVGAVVLLGVLGIIGLFEEKPSND